jgi:hypothetical protein
MMGREKKVLDPAQENTRVEITFKAKMILQSKSISPSSGAKVKTASSSRCSALPVATYRRCYLEAAEQAEGGLQLGSMG